MDTVLCFMCNDVKCRADLWIWKKSYQNTFEKGKTSIQIYWYSHFSEKWYLETEHLKNECVNLIVV